jgi:aminoglycoside 6'-N-acetyltransferase I
MRLALWPDDTQRNHASAARRLLNGRRSGTLPEAVFVAEATDGAVIGFAEVGLRSHVDGCDPVRPSGYLEGWFVDARWRRKGVGRALVAAGERWARALGCKEMGSDALAHNRVSLRAHDAIGYEVVDRCVNFRKTL